jgi:hypothetical protein
MILNAIFSLLIIVIFRNEENNIRLKKIENLIFNFNLLFNKKKLKGKDPSRFFNMAFSLSIVGIL